MKDLFGWGLTHTTGWGPSRTECWGLSRLELGHFYKNFPTFSIHTDRTPFLYRIQIPLYMSCQWNATFSCYLSKMMGWSDIGHMKGNNSLKQNKMKENNWKLQIIFPDLHCRLTSKISSQSQHLKNTVRIDFGLRTCYIHNKFKINDH